MAKKNNPGATFEQKIRKNAPFDLSVVKEEYPKISHLLAFAVSQIKELPDFSDYDKIAIMSDFGGEHSGAHFNTYSFLILAYSKIGPFIEQVEILRRKHNLTNPYSEFSFKDLGYGSRSRALPEFLHLVDNLIHGALITIAVDKQVPTVFGVSKKETHQLIEEHFFSLDLGKWKGKEGEKVLRVCHSIALFTALTTKENQRLLWYCDNDAINENARERSFADTQQIFIRVLSMYSRHKFELIGFGKSFDGKSHLDDLLSIPGFAAGIVQDLLKSHKTRDDNIPGGEEKAELLRWMARKSKFLSKITIQICKLESGELGCGIVDFLPAK